MAGIRTCPVCGLSYVPSDAEDRKIHNARHREAVEPFEPKPLKSLPRSGLQRVNIRSPLWMHRQMYLRANAFRKEFRYDFAQWAYYSYGGRASGEPDATAEGYLFVDKKKRVVGACAFRWRVYGNSSSGWALQWVWFAPKFRRMGFLHDAWAIFRGQYGNFHVEAPVSAAMQSFLRKHGDLHLM